MPDCNFLTECATEDKIMEYKSQAARQYGARDIIFSALDASWDCAVVKHPNLGVNRNNFTLICGDCVATIGVKVSKRGPVRACVTDLAGN